MTSASAVACKQDVADPVTATELDLPLLDYAHSGFQFIVSVLLGSSDGPDSIPFAYLACYSMESVPSEPHIHSHLHG